MPPKAYRPVEYPKLGEETVRMVYASPYRRTWLADHHGIPRRLVTLIKNAATVDDALAKYGN